MLRSRAKDAALHEPLEGEGGCAVMLAFKLNITPFPEGIRGIISEPDQRIVLCGRTLFSRESM